VRLLRGRRPGSDTRSPKLWSGGCCGHRQWKTQARVDQALAKLGGGAEGLAADLGTAEGAAEAIRRFPDVDILVNNLGIFDPKPFEKISDQEWLRFF